MAAAPHHLIVTKSSYFEQYKSNHYKWRKRTKKYQNDKYVYLTPPVLLIFIKYTSKLLIFIGVYQIYTLIFYNFTKTKAVLLQATGLKHLAYEIISSE